MNRRPAARFAFDFFEPLPIQIEVSDAPLTSDAGLLPLRQFDQRIGLTKQFAAGPQSCTSSQARATMEACGAIPRIGTRRVFKAFPLTREVRDDLRNAVRKAARATASA